LVKDLNGSRWITSVRVSSQVDLPEADLVGFCEKLAGCSQYKFGERPNESDWSYHRSAGGYTFFFDDQTNADQFEFVVKSFVKGNTTMFDSMGKQWDYSKEVSKTNTHTLDEMIEFCTKYFGQSYYSWSLGHDVYKFFFNQKHHEDAFSDFVNDLSCMAKTEVQPRLPDGRFAPKRAASSTVVSGGTNVPNQGTAMTDKEVATKLREMNALLTAKPKTKSISVSVNDKRVSITFIALSEDKVRELAEYLVTQCYDAEKAAVDAQVPKWTYETFSKALYDEFYADDVNADKTKHYKALINLFDSAMGDQNRSDELEEWIRRFINETFVVRNQYFGINEIGRFTNFLEEQFDWYV
jgi:hypothetical protein